MQNDFLWSVEKTTRKVAFKNYILALLINLNYNKSNEISNLTMRSPIKIVTWIFVCLNFTVCNMGRDKYPPPYHGFINRLISFVVPSLENRNHANRGIARAAYLGKESSENFGSPCISTNLRCWKITQFVLYFTHVSQILSPDKRSRTCFLFPQRKSGGTLWVNCSFNGYKIGSRLKITSLA